MLLAVASCAASRAIGAEQTASWEVPAILEPADDGTGTWHHTETVHLVAHAGRLFAGMGQWMHPNPNGAAVLVKDTATGPWRVVSRDEALRVTALKSFAIPASLNGGVGTHVLLASGRRQGSTNIQILRDDATAFTDSLVLAGSDGEIRSFAGRAESGQYAFYAGVSPDGILRGIWNVLSQTIDWNRTAEVQGEAGGRFMAMAECRGALYASNKSRLYRRNDGVLAASVPRWVVIMEAPGVIAQNSGLRGLTCVLHNGQESLLVAFEGDGLVWRIDDLPTGSAGSFPPPVIVTELDIRMRLREELARNWNVSAPASGRGAVVYVIPAYNEFLPVEIDGQPAQLFGVEWAYGTAAPAGRSASELYNNIAFDNAAGFFIRTEGPSGPTFTFCSLAGPDFAPGPVVHQPILHGEAFVSTRTIRESPFGDGRLYFGGYDCNYVPANGTAWIATARVEDVYRSVVVSLGVAIATQPQSQTATPGQNAIFTVGAWGNPVPAYQWQRLPAGSTTWVNLAEGGSYHGVTTATLAVSATTAAMSTDQFRCVIANAVGTATSSAAVLTVSGAATALLQYPASIAEESYGNLYVADSSSNTILKITPAGVVSTLAGSAGQAGSQDGTGGDARFNQPGGLVVDAAGNVYVTDTGNAIIRKITPAGAVTTFAGSAASRGNRDGIGPAASFNAPTGIAADASGNLYVADAFNATIRKITPDGTVSTLAGAAGVLGDADGAGSAARFNHPSGIATDSRQIYVADTYNATIRRITLDGVVTTVAGSAGISGGNDGTGSYALFNQPAGVAVDLASDAGNFYVADTGNGTIRRVTASGIVTTLAGIAGIAGWRDGAGGIALFNQPRGLVVDGNRDLWVADTGNAAVRRIAPDRTVTTLALTAATTPAPPPSGGTTTPPVTGTGSASGGGGGGAMESWFAAALAVLGLPRWAVRRR